MLPTSYRYILEKTRIKYPIIVVWVHDFKYEIRFFIEYRYVPQNPTFARENYQNKNFESSFEIGVSEVSDFKYQIRFLIWLSNSNFTVEMTKI